jgi:hypothetical protein
MRISVIVVDGDPDGFRFCHAKSVSIKSRHDVRGHLILHLTDEARRMSRMHSGGELGRSKIVPLIVMPIAAKVAFFRGWEHGKCFIWKAGPIAFIAR